MGIYLLLLIHSSLMCQTFILHFWGFVVYIRVCCLSTYSVNLYEDLSSTLCIRSLFSLLWFYPLFQGRFVYPDYRRFVSIVLVWICPLLLLKLGFMAAYSVILCEDSSSTLLIHPLFSLLWFYPLFQGRFVYPDYKRFVSIVLVWIHPLWLIKLGFMAFINLRLDLFWHKKEAAASTVCLTGFPCCFFWFFGVAHKAWLFGSLFCHFMGGFVRNFMD